MDDSERTNELTNQDYEPADVVRPRPVAAFCTLLEDGEGLLERLLDALELVIADREQQVPGLVVAAELAEVVAGRVGIAVSPLNFSLELDHRPLALAVGCAARGWDTVDRDDHFGDVRRL